jgi:hypothetical protein
MKMDKVSLSDLLESISATIALTSIMARELLIESYHIGSVDKGDVVYDAILFPRYKNVIL